MKKKKKQLSIIHNDTNTLDRLGHDILEYLILNFLEYRDMVLLMRTAKYYPTLLRNTANKFFNNSAFTVSLIRREINHYLVPIQFSEFYKPKTSLKLSESLLWVLHTLINERITDYQKAITILNTEKNVWVEEEFLKMELVRAMYTNNRELGFKNLNQYKQLAMQSLQCAILFYTSFPSLHNTLALIDYFFMTFPVYGFTELLHQLHEINKYVGRKQAYGSYWKNNEKRLTIQAIDLFTWDSVNPVEKSLLLGLMESIFVKALENSLAEEYLKLNSDLRHIYLRIFSFFRGDQLFLELSEHSLTPALGSLNCPYMLTGLLSPKTHWIFDYYESKVFKQLMSMGSLEELYPNNLNWNDQSFFLKLVKGKFPPVLFTDNLKDKTIQAKVKSGSVTLFSSYREKLFETEPFLKDYYLKLISNKSLHLYSQISKIICANQGSLLKDLVKFFDPKDAIVLLTTKELFERLPAIIQKYKTFTQLKQLNIRSKPQDIELLNMLTDLDDEVIKKILDFITMLGFENWSTLKPFSKKFLFDLQKHSYEINNDQLATCVMKKFSDITRINNISKRDDLQHLFLKHSDSPLFTHLTLDQLIALKPKVIKNLLEENTTIQSLVTKDLAQKTEVELLSIKVDLIKAKKLYHFTGTEFFKRKSPDSVNESSTDTKKSKLKASDQEAPKPL